jgi:hypothetical protein
MPTADTAASKTDSASTFVADTAKQTSDQIISAVRQTTKLSLDTASAWFDTLTAVLPAAPAVPASSRAVVQQWVAASFDTAESVLAMQRELASEFVTKLVPAAN